MTKEQIEELREKAKQATPGPWETEGGKRDTMGYYLVSIRAGDKECVNGPWCTRREGIPADAAYIAALNPDTCLKLTSLALDALSLRELVKEASVFAGRVVNYVEFNIESDFRAMNKEYLARQHIEASPLREEALELREKLRAATGGEP